MRLYLKPISSMIFLLFWGYVAWTWVRWIKSGDKQSLKWQTITIIVGLCLATISSILSAFLYIHAVFTGGYPYYAPVELFCIRVGTLTSLLGLAATFAGKGRLRIPVAVISSLNLLLWFIDAVGQ